MPLAPACYIFRKCKVEGLSSYGTAADFEQVVGRDEGGASAGHAEAVPQLKGMDIAAEGSNIAIIPLLTLSQG
jgi:hypothetical protein